MKAIIFSLTLLLLLLSETSVAQAYQQLWQGFKKPAGTALPKVYWWWLNGNVDTVRLKEELRSIKNAGIGGVDIFEIGVTAANNTPAGPAFMGNESLKAIEIAIREATRLNLEVGLNLASSWNAGGSWITPRYAAKSLYYSKTVISGNGQQPVQLPFPVIPKLDEKGRPRVIEVGADGKPTYHEEVAVLAIPVRNGTAPADTADIINISQFFDAKKETLTWKAPAGNWEIYRYVCANSGEQLKLPSPNSKGPIIDHFDSTATRAHFMYFINKLKPVLGDFRKTTLKTLYLASYEATGFVWTPTLPQQFRKVNGYDIYKLLPALFTKNTFSPAVETVLTRDFTRTLSELISQNHYRKGREIANSYGLQLTSEAGGPGQPLHNVPVEALKALGSLDVPRGEFWNNYYYYDTDSTDIMWLVKEIAAAAHLYNRKIIEEESFTSFQHWQEGPFDLKPLADRAFCEGMNRVVVHGFSHNPRGTGVPGIVYHAGTHYNDKRVWWPKIKPFNEYLARISSVMQQASFVADVLYYYGDQVPNFVAPKNSRFRVGPGYDYEVINTEMLLRDLTVKDGQLALPNGSRFKVLALEEQNEVSPQVVAKINALIRQGAAVAGSWPRSMTGKPGGASLKNASALALLQSQHIPPDFDYPESKRPVFDFIHYRYGEVDAYFVRNTTNQYVSRLCQFRQQGKSPELWNPVTGDVLPISVYTQHGQQIELPLTVPPYGAYFVVFRKKATPLHYKAITSSGAHPPLMAYTAAGLHFLEEGTVTLSGSAKTDRLISKPVERVIEGPWQLTFPAGWGAPAKLTLPNLLSWSEVADKGVAYFSGIATYDKTVPLSKAAAGERVFLDLGKLSRVADVWLNGQHLGISWAEPHQFDITDILKPGENKLTIEVANTWSNRLTGDALTGETYTKTPITQSAKGISWARTPLPASGLLGPVTIRTLKLIR